MKPFCPLVLMAVGATASTFPRNNVSFGIVRRQPSLLVKQESNNNSKPSDSESTLSSMLSIRGGAYDPYMGDIYYSEVSPENSMPEQGSHDITYPTNTNNNNNDNTNDDTPVVSSSQVMYEGGCFVSSDSVGPVESMFNSFFKSFGDSEEDDDDDDDDNDGHSSMLANGSLTQSRRMQSAADRSYQSYASSAVYLESEVQFQ
ncbi:unnamed protein product [Cylindrotheca closterium]|uniref:Uncharacterized protein n=1 Tax=Cylindrotheca closterium TaxID=2856 RepID=A0AAD2CEE1_9STRA|nr:unnamed protein product [Cylindrotheca closterium]